MLADLPAACPPSLAAVGQGRGRGEEGRKSDDGREQERGEEGAVNGDGACNGKEEEREEGEEVGEEDEEEEEGEAHDEEDDDEEGGTEGEIVGEGKDRRVGRDGAAVVGSGVGRLCRARVVEEGKGLGEETSCALAKSKSPAAQHWAIAEVSGTDVLRHLKMRGDFSNMLRGSLDEDYLKLLSCLNAACPRSYLSLSSF